MARRRRYYSEDDIERGITPSELKRAGRERQKEYMHHWFHRNFEDPVQETPYNSQEGGYLYIWGGPYDAREQLYDEFRYRRGGRIRLKTIEISRVTASVSMREPSLGRSAPQHSCDLGQEENMLRTPVLSRARLCAFGCVRAPHYLPKWCRAIFMRLRQRLGCRRKSATAYNVNVASQLAPSPPLGPFLLLKCHFDPSQALVMLVCGSGRCVRRALAFLPAGRSSGRYR
jgi:hypothetical protein